MSSSLVRIFSIIFGCFLFVSTCADPITCVDEEGNPVDWYIVYKLPHELGERGSNLYNGTAYMYLDVNNQEFTLSENDVNSTKSAFYRTLKPVYESYDNDMKTSSIAFGFYNDQPPDDSYSTYRGHSKGAWAFDADQGFFLTHSVPKFPNYLQNGFSYPSSGAYYGQSMMCVTLPSASFNSLGTHFLYTYPLSYNVSVPEELQSMVPNLVKSVVEEDHVTEKPYTAVEDIETIGGVSVKLFSKWKDADEDMISEFMAPELKSDLFAQTWQNSSPNLPSDCQDTYWTYTVEHMYISEIDVGFSTHDDHSKWAVGAPDGFKYNSDWVCIGDMNRQESQEDRCGGFMCFENDQVNKQYVQMTVDLLDCDDYGVDARKRFEKNVKF